MSDKNVNKEHYIIVQNVGKLSAILDIYTSMTLSYDEGSEERKLIEKYMDDVDTLMRTLVSRYNEKYSKQ